MLYPSSLLHRCNSRVEKGTWIILGWIRLCDNYAPREGNGGKAGRPMLVGKPGKPVGRLGRLVGSPGMSVGRLTPGRLGKLGRPVGRPRILVGMLNPGRLGKLGRPVGSPMDGKPAGRLSPGNPPSPGRPVGKLKLGRLNPGKLRPGGIREPKRTVRKFWNDVLRLQ